MTLTDSTTGQCYEDVTYIFSNLPANTAKLTAIASGTVEGSSLSTVDVTYTDLTIDSSTTTGTGAPAGLNITIQHLGSNNPKSFRLQGQFQRPIDLGATLTVVAKDSSDVPLASGTISGLSHIDCS